MIYKSTFAILYLRRKIMCNKSRHEFKNSIYYYTKLIMRGSYDKLYGKFISYALLYSAIFFLESWLSRQFCVWFNLDNLD